MIYTCEVKFSIKKLETSILSVKLFGLNHQIVKYCLVDNDMDVK